MERTADGAVPKRPRKKELSWQAVYYHFQKWSADGSLQRVWEQSIETTQPDLDSTHLNLEGSHALAKKGGESVAYQHRKRAKTSNILPITDAQGYVLASTGMIAGNRHDAFDLKPHLQAAFKRMKRLGLTIAGAYFNADSAFDTLEARKVGFNHHVIPNICENKRNRKQTIRGRNAGLMRRSTSSASPVNAALLGLTSFEPCSFAMTARMPTFSVLTIWLLRSFTCDTCSH